MGDITQFKVIPQQYAAGQIYFDDGTPEQAGPEMFLEKCQKLTFITIDDKQQNP